MVTSHKNLATTWQAAYKLDYRERHNEVSWSRNKVNEDPINHHSVEFIRK